MTGTGRRISVEDVRTRQGRVIFQLGQFLPRYRLDDRHCRAYAWVVVPSSRLPEDDYSPTLWQEEEEVTMAVSRQEAKETAVERLATTDYYRILEINLTHPAPSQWRWRVLIEVLGKGGNVPMKKTCLIDAASGQIIDCNLER